MAWGSADSRGLAAVKLPSDQGEFLVDLGAAEGDVGRRHNVFTVVVRSSFAAWGGLALTPPWDAGRSL